MTQQAAKQLAAVATRRFNKGCFAFHAGLTAGIEKQMPLALICGDWRS
jgi:hypothetical protein